MNMLRYCQIRLSLAFIPLNHPTQPSSVTNSSVQDEPNIDESQSLEKEQEKHAGEKKAEKTMKEEIKTLRERIMDEVEKGLKEKGIELNLSD